jgi:hypothetical protein
MPVCGLVLMYYCEGFLLVLGDGKMEFQSLSSDRLYNIVVAHCRKLKRAYFGYQDNKLETIQMVLIRTGLQFDIERIWKEFVFQWNNLEELEKSKERFKTARNKTIAAGTNVHVLLKRDMIQAIFNWQEKNQPAQVVSQES